MIRKLLVIFFLANLLYAEDLLLLEKLQLNQEVKSASFVIVNEHAALEVKDVSILQLLVGTDTTSYYFVAKLPKPQGDFISYCLKIQLANEEIISQLKLERVSNLLWSDSGLSELDSSVAKIKLELDALLLNKDIQKSRIRALKADAATVTELDRIANIRLKLKDLDTQQFKLDQDQALTEAQLQQTSSIREPFNSGNRIRELESALAKLREKLKTLQEQGYDPASGAGIEQKLKLIEDSNREDLNLLELELENLKNERLNLENQSDW